MEEQCACCHKTKVREEQEYKSLIHRLNRIEGQIRGIKGMVEKMPTARIFWCRLRRPMPH